MTVLQFLSQTCLIPFDRFTSLTRALGNARAATENVCEYSCQSHHVWSFWKSFEIYLTTWLCLALFNVFQLVPLVPFCAFLLNASTSFSLKRSLGRQDMIGDKLIRLNLSRYSKDPVTSAFHVFPLCKIKTLCFSFSQFFLQSMKYNSHLTALPCLQNHACKKS